jgi:oligopeptide/dipeptide ABC transporter ATP-binding protein
MTQISVVADPATKPLLVVDDLYAVYDSHRGEVHALNGVSFHVRSGEVLALVGESGSGKSATAFGIMGLLPHTRGRVVNGSIEFDGVDLTKISEAKYRDVRGGDIALIFQNPMTTLNPTLTIGSQLIEVIRQHKAVSKAEARTRAIELLGRVEIPRPETRLKSYPHELSGGLRQRVMIALALSCEPRLLIADEATTALDVTTQAQVLRLMRNIVRESNAALLLITHNMGVVAGLADRVAVMYAGRIVEIGDVKQVFHQPQHPYTVGLLGAVPRMDAGREEELLSVEGRPPSLLDLPGGCTFADRCWLATAQCFAEVPDPVDPVSHSASCWADPKAVRRIASDPSLTRSNSEEEN